MKKYTLLFLLLAPGMLAEQSKKSQATESALNKLIKKADDGDEEAQVIYGLIDTLVRKSAEQQEAIEEYEKEEEVQLGAQLRNQIGNDSISFNHYTRGKNKLNVNLAEKKDLALEFYKDKFSDPTDHSAFFWLNLASGEAVYNLKQLSPNNHLRNQAISFFNSTRDGLMAQQIQVNSFAHLQNVNWTDSYIFQKIGATKPINGWSLMTTYVLLDQAHKTSIGQKIGEKTKFNKLSELEQKAVKFIGAYYIGPYIISALPCIKTAGSLAVALAIQFVLGDIIPADISGLDFGM